MSHKKHKVRSIALILTGLMLGALTIAPAFANHTPKHTKKQIAKVKKALSKKIKNITNTVKTLPTTSAVQQAIDAATALTVKQVTGDGEATIVSAGGFSVVLTCNIETTPTSDEADLELRTTVNGVVLDDNNGPEFSGPDPFDIADSPYAYNGPGGFVSGDDLSELEGTYPGLTARLPDGTIVTVTDYMIGVNMPLGTCLFTGNVKVF